LVWLKSHWRWVTLNLFAVFVSGYVATQGTTGWEDVDTFDTGLESGKWAIRFLLTSLMMTPLNTYFGWKGGIKLRKSAGLWAFGFAVLHILVYIREAKFRWLTMSMPFYLWLGLAGITILTILACTSNRWAMKELGKNWKRLHRLVYVSGIAVVTHSTLATTMSKKLYFRDPDAQEELKIYAAMLCVLLIMRIPLVRQCIMQVPVLFKRKQKLTRPVHRPDGEELMPHIQGRESSVSVEPTFVILSPPPLNNINKISESYEEGPSREIQLEGETEVQ
jgi:sulfoxide reductase heme-binding subunit YedZ